MSDRPNAQAGAHGIPVFAQMQGLRSARGAITDHLAVQPASRTPRAPRIMTIRDDVYGRGARHRRLRIAEATRYLLLRQSALLAPL